MKKCSWKAPILKRNETPRVLQRNPPLHCAGPFENAAQAAFKRKDFSLLRNDRLRARSLLQLIDSF
jgi:hypothetical protein